MKIAFAALALLTALAQPAGRAETVTIGAEDDWAPYSSLVGKEATGFAVDVVRAAFAEVGVTVRFEVLPYTRCKDEARIGRLAGCFDTIRTAETVPQFLWHETPLFMISMNVYAPAASNERGLRPAALEGKTVGVERGYEYGDDFDGNPRIRRKVVDRNFQGFRMLLSGRLQYMAAEERNAEAVFRQFPDEFGNKFKKVGVLITQGCYVAFTRKTADGARYMALFNRGFGKLRAGPGYRALEAKWFGAAAAAR